jgi:hypothetical protein
MPLYARLLDLRSTIINGLGFRTVLIYEQVTGLLHGVPFKTQPNNNHVQRYKN